MTLVLPSSPCFAGDMFEPSLTASLFGGTVGLRAWTVTLRFDSNGIDYISHAIDGRWAGAQAIPSSTSIRVLVNTPSVDDATSLLVRGLDIPILTTRMRVRQTASPGVFHMSADIDAMLNFGSAFMLLK